MHHLWLTSLVLMSGLASAYHRIPNQLHKPNPTDACCCCDMSQNAISCTNDIAASDCVCAAVVCPAGAPTVWADGSKSATPTPTAVVTTTTTTKPKYPDPTELAPCCCCDLRVSNIICDVRQRQDCYCVAAECPSGAETKWVQPTSSANGA